MAAVSLPADLVPVTVLRRANRFAVEALDAADRRPLYLHLPNSGRMRELLGRGTAGLAHLRPAAAPAAAAAARTAEPARRTDGTLLLVRHGTRWVGVDAHLPNRLLAAGLAAGELAPFRGFTSWRAEVPVGGARLDFRLAGPAGACLVEVKSCNLVTGGVALFPDAPTARGARHARLLAGCLGPGLRAAVVWFIQRDDAAVLRPFRQADPDFAAAVAEAAAAGVELYAYACRVAPHAVSVLAPIPVDPS